MNLFSLFTANVEWDETTELVVIYNHDDKAVQDSGKALDIVCKYGEFRVCSFRKNIVTLKEKIEIYL